MTLVHPELGLVPTYGGPYDSYTIPHMLGAPSEQMHERELEVHRYDHDIGSWVDDETIPLRVIHDDFLPSDETAAQPVGELTDEQIDAALRAARLINTTESRKDMRRAIEAAHKIGGHG